MTLNYIKKEEKFFGKEIVIDIMEIVDKTLTLEKLKILKELNLSV